MYKGTQEKEASPRGICGPQQPGRRLMTKERWLCLGTERTSLLPRDNIASSSPLSAGHLPSTELTLYLQHHI